MQAIPRRAAAQALSARPAAFVCPSCVVTSSTLRSSKTTSHHQQSHFSAPPLRRYATDTASLPQATPAGFAHLTSRSLISIAGVDAAKFLHGIVTANTLSLNSQGIYTGFLNALGRVLHDVFIYPDVIGVGVNATKSSDPANAFIIEVGTQERTKLIKHLNRYKLRSKVKIAPVEVDELAVYQAWNSSSPSSLSLANNKINTESPQIILPDRRAPGLGTRILSSASSYPSLSETLQSHHNLTETTDTSYQIHRYLHGVPEGQSEISYEHALPLDSNMDLMNGIDFRKGCYVGQELTIRTKHRGVVRKRILPCLLYPYDNNPTTTTTNQQPDKLEYDPTVGGTESGGITAQDLPSGLPIRRETKGGRPTATWLRGVGNIGLALVRLTHMTDVTVPGEPETTRPYKEGQEFFLETDEDSSSGGGGGGGGGGGDVSSRVRVRAFVPPWLRQKLDEEIEANAKRHSGAREVVEETVI